MGLISSWLIEKYAVLVRCFAINYNLKRQLLKLAAWFSATLKHPFCPQFDGIHVVSGSLDTSIRVWDVETGNCIHTLTGHQSLTSGMELKDNILVSGNADSTVKIWDIKTGQCLQTLQGELDIVWALQLIGPGTFKHW